MSRPFLLCFLFAAGCGSRPTTTNVGEDAAVAPDKGPSVCELPAGRCVADTDCPKGWACTARQANPEEQCERASCCPDVATASYSDRAGVREESHYPRPDCKSLCLGQCARPGQPLATCASNADCPDADYCRFARQCAGEGLCEPRPIICAESSDGDAPPGGDWAWPPLFCGCDGNTYTSECDAALAGSSVTYNGPCQDPQCEGVSCSVFTDCCSCEAYDQLMGSPGVCDAACEIDACSRQGIYLPTAYCLAGHCLLTDRSQNCISDADCLLINDCCSCAALPPTMEAKPCPADCEVGHCTALGITNPVARCIEGTCRVSK